MLTLTQHAEQLLEDAKRLDAFTTSRNLPATSLDEDTLIDLSTEGLEIRNRVVDGAHKVKKLALGGIGNIHEAMWGPVDSVVLHFIYHYRIAQTIDRSSGAQPITFRDLHVKLPNPKPPIDRLRRFLQVAAANYIFRQPTPDTIAHNAASRALVNVAGLSDWVGVLTEDLIPAIHHIIEATEKFPSELEEPDKAGFQIAHGTTDKLYSFMAKNPGRAKRFGAGMTYLTASPGYNIDIFVHGYRGWTDLNTRGRESEMKGTGKAKAVDVAGGHGAVSIALAKAFPHIEFVVQDLPNVVEDGETQLKATDDPLDRISGNREDWKTRVSFMPQDIFEEQQIKEADVYFTRWIMHNHADSYCVKILKSLVPALKRGKSKVVLYEYILPEIAEVSYTEKIYARNTDILMMGGWNSKQRTEKEFQKLFETADPGYSFQGAVRPKGSGMWVIEANYNE